MFRRIFGRKASQAAPRDGLVLNLKYEPVPEHAPAFAADIVDSSREVAGVRLDYTPDSLVAVDEILEGFRADGVTSNQVGETLFGFGCYVGEVFVRNAGGEWRRTEATPMRDVAGLAFVIELPDGSYCNPMGKVFKRLDNGPVDSLAYFYRVFALGERRDIAER